MKIVHVGHYPNYLAELPLSGSGCTKCRSAAALFSILAWLSRCVGLNVIPHGTFEFSSSSVQLETMTHRWLNVDP